MVILDSVSWEHSFARMHVCGYVNALSHGKITSTILEREKATRDIGGKKVINKQGQLSFQKLNQHLLREACDLFLCKI